MAKEEIAEDHSEIDIPQAAQPVARKRRARGMAHFEASDLNGLLAEDPRAVAGLEEFVKKVLIGKVRGMGGPARFKEPGDFWVCLAELFAEARVYLWTKDRTGRTRLHSLIQGARNDPAYFENRLKKALHYFLLQKRSAADPEQDSMVRRIRDIFKRDKGFVRDKARRTVRLASWAGGLEPCRRGLVTAAILSLEDQLRGLVEHKADGMIARHSLIEILRRILVETGPIDQRHLFPTLTDILDPQSQEIAFSRIENKHASEDGERSSFVDGIDHEYLTDNAEIRLAVGDLAEALTPAARSVLVHSITAGFSVKNFQHDAWRETGYSAAELRRGYDELQSAARAVFDCDWPADWAVTAIRMAAERAVETATMVEAYAEKETILSFAAPETVAIEAVA